MDIEQLTETQRRERFLTLLMIAIFALLTGIDYAIILPTAWGYVNTFMKEHYGGFVIGILISAFALSGAIAGLILGYCNDIGFSLKRLVLFGSACQVIGNILYFIGINIYVLVLSRLIAGIGMGVVPPLLAEISRQSTPETRTQLLGKILACRQIGLFLGPCFTIFLKHWNFTLFNLPVNMHNGPGLLMAFLWIIIFGLTIFFFYDSSTDNENPKTFSAILCNHSFSNTCNGICRVCRKPVVITLLITTFIAYFNQTTLETMLTPFTNTQFNWHELEVSIIFAAAGIELALVYLILHFLAKKYSDQSILLTAFIILSFACLIGVIILPFATVGSQKYVPAFLLFVASDVFTLPLIVVTTTSLFTQQTRHDQQGTGQGIQRFVVNVATILGPLYAGALLPSAWTIIASMFVIVVIGTILLILVYRSFQLTTVGESSALIPSENN